MLPISAPPHEGPAQNGPEPHTVHVEQVYTLLGTVKDRGLTPQIVASRIQTDGKNTVKPPSGTPMIFRFFIAVFLSGFSPILWIADGLAWAIYPPPLSDPANPVNLALAVILLVVLLFSGLMTFWQEFQTDRTLNAFQKRLAHSATVVREGQIMQVPTSELVRGDIVDLGTGEKVPADLRIIHASALSLNNSPLTGESKPILSTSDAVTCPYTESSNMAWMGTTVVAGIGRGIVVHTGERTRIGIVMRLTGQAKPGRTTLESELLRFVIIIALIALCCGAFCIGLWGGWLTKDYNSYMSLSAMLSNVIGLIVGAIPTGLPISVTLTLVVMIRRLVKRHNVLAKQLAIIDTIGCMNMLLSDKTGTLTTGIMTLEKVINIDRNHHNEYSTYNFNFGEFGKKTPYSDKLLKAMVLCNGAELTNTGEAVNGNATDTALLNFVQRNMPGYAHSVHEECPSLVEVPFSSSTKVMLSVNQIAGQPTVFVKGAFEVVLEKFCGKVRLPNNEEVPLIPSMLEALYAEAKTLGSKSFRVLAVAELPLDPTKYPANFDWNAAANTFPRENMTLLGLFALLDPPRAEVPNAVNVLRRAGIKVSMVTGDHPATAEGIARMIGILTRPLEDGFNKTKSRLIRGPEIAGFDKDAWDSIAECDELVFARTTPEDKMRIVEQMRERDRVIAVIGDGVNDAPALKMSNVGIAMGSGTDVAIEAAKVVLMNDSFASVPKAVEFGRLSFVNLRKVSIYLLPAGSFSEAIPVIVNFALGIPLALSPIFAIVICCLTDVASSMALVLEEAESDIMNQPPRSLKNDRLVDGKLIGHAYLFIGVLECMFAFINYFWYMTSMGFPLSSLFFAWGWGSDGFEGTTAAYQADCLAVGQSVYFVTLVVCQFGNLMTTRKRRLPYFYTPKDKNSRAETYESIRIADGSSSTVAEKQDHGNNHMLTAARIIGCCVVSLFFTLMFTEVPAISSGIASGSVPGEHWGMAIGCAVFIFGISELRKWIMVWYPNCFLHRIAW